MYKIVISILLSFLMVTILLPSIPVLATEKKYTQQVKSGVDAFPSSYQQALRQLQKAYPNWNFEAYYTGIDWSDLVANEVGPCSNPKNRIYYTRKDSWKCNCGFDASYTCANESIIKYYMDPRNFLNEFHIFQFQDISYQQGEHTLEQVKQSLQGTFMNKEVTYQNEEGKEVTKHYADIILEAAKATGWSPIHIKAKIVQEVGSKGSDSVSGTYEGYEGYYNFFNYGANDSGNAIANGLSFAKEQGWNNPYKAIVDGAKLICNSYVNAGQNTQYFFKFDVVGDSILKNGQTQTITQSLLFKHQYMTNVEDPYNQSKATYNMYANANDLDSKKTFIIPVYDNMPEYNKKPSKLTEKDGTLYYTTVMSESLPVRNKPGIWWGIIEELDRDEVVVLMEKNADNVDGLVWDKVKLEDGQIGYVNSEYLSPCIPSSMTDFIISKTAKEITCGSATKAQHILGQYTSAIIKDKEGKVVAKDTALATGMKITMDNISYTVIKLGDTDGDGEITSIDLLVLQRHILGIEKLDAIYKKAGMITDTTDASSIDLLVIQRHVLGLEFIKV